MDVVEGVALEQLARLVAEHPMHGRARILEHAVLAHDRHDVGRVLDQGAEVLLAPPHRVFGATPIDGCGDNARHRLHEMRVVDGEVASARRVRAQNSEGAVLPVDHHADTRDGPVRRQERRAAEPGVRRQILDYHRPPRAKHVLRVRIRVSGQDRAPHDAVTPPHPRAEHEGTALGVELEHAPELDVEHPRHEGYGRPDQLFERRTRQGSLAQVCHGLLLPGRGAQLRLRSR